MSQIRHLGWETLCGGSVLLSILIAGIAMPYVLPEAEQPNREDAFCTPGLIGESVSMAGAAQGDASGGSEDDLLGGAQSAETANATQGKQCSRNYPFGTDVSGRDIFYYMMVASTKYFLPSLIVLAISILLGSLFGVMAGYYGESFAGHGGSMISNAISVYPPLLFVLLITRILNNPPITVIAGVFALTESARLGFMVMNKIQVLREEEFISAAKEMGLSDWRIITKHLLWYNCREVLFVHGVFSVAGFVMVELYLGYLNAGNFGAWGAIIGPGSRDFNEHWWLLVLPSALVIVTIFSFYLIGDGLVKYFSAQLNDAPEEAL